MIDTQFDRIVIECDACDSVFDSGAEDCGSLEWAVVWPVAKREGWKARRIAEEWMQFCPRCKP